MYVKLVTKRVADGRDVNTRDSIGSGAAGGTTSDTLTINIRDIVDDQWKDYYTSFIYPKISGILYIGSMSLSNASTFSNVYLSNTSGTWTPAIASVTYNSYSYGMQVSCLNDTLNFRILSTFPADAPEVVFAVIVNVEDAILRIANELLFSDLGMLPLSEVTNNSPSGNDSSSQIFVGSNSIKHIVLSGGQSEDDYMTAGMKLSNTKTLTDIVSNGYNLSYSSGNKLMELTFACPTTSSSIQPTYISMEFANRTYYLKFSYVSSTVSDWPGIYMEFYYTINGQSGEYNLFDWSNGIRVAYSGNRIIDVCFVKKNGDLLLEYKDSGFDSYASYKAQPISTYLHGSINLSKTSSQYKFSEFIDTSGNFLFGDGSFDIRYRNYATWGKYFSYGLITPISGSSSSSSGSGGSGSSSSSGSGGGCISGDTILTTNNGNKLARDVHKDDYILCMTESGPTYSKVTVRYVNSKPIDLYQIIFKDSSSLDITDNHPILTAEGYKTISAKDLPKLQVGDNVMTITGYVEVESIDNMGLEDKVYNFLTECDNFIANGVVVACEDPNVEIVSTDTLDGVVEIGDNAKL